MFNVYIVLVLFGSVCGQIPIQPFEIFASSQGLTSDVTTSIQDLNNVMTTSNPSGITDYLGYTDSTDFPVYPDTGASSESSSNENVHRVHGKHHEGPVVGNEGFEGGFGNGQGNGGLEGNLGIFGGSVVEGLNRFGKTGQRELGNLGGNKGKNC